MGIWGFADVFVLRSLHDYLLGCHSIALKICYPNASLNVCTPDFNPVQMLMFERL